MPEPSMPSAATRAYATTARSGWTGRNLEAEVLLQCASELDWVAGRDEGPEALIAAVERNRKLWSAFAEAMRDPDALHSAEFRERMTMVARFVFARTHRVAETGDRTLIPPLAAINRQIAAGLRGSLPPPA